MVNSLFIFLSIFLTFSINTHAEELNDAKKSLVQLNDDYLSAIECLESSANVKNAVKKILQSEFCVRFEFKNNAYFQIRKIHSANFNTPHLARVGIRLNTEIGHALPYLLDEDEWKNQCRFLKPRPISKVVIIEQAPTPLISIYYGNGMFNTMNDVQNSLIELKKLDLSAIGQPIQYKLALNLNESDLSNILSVIEQKGDGDLSYFWDVLDGVLPMPSWLNEPIENALLNRPHSATLSQMHDLYQAEFASKTKVILVSHSQGNFYAEEIEKQLSAEHQSEDLHNFGFGNVRVATPTQTAFQYPYFTFQDDLIINLARKVFLGAPLANLITLGSGPGPELDPNGHNFVNAYLINSESRERIRQAILTESSLLHF